MKTDKDETYTGFEQGPIRPPSEALSLLIRVTRNCPWNRCTFCPVYKGASFSLRPVNHVIQDIDTVHRFVSLLKERNNGLSSTAELQSLTRGLTGPERMAMSAALNWLREGMKSVFLQDANSLIIKPHDLIAILKHLRYRFPQIERITSYARSHTICRIKDDKLQEMAEAGLNRIHIGMESGSDEVLKMVKKGATKKDHIEAGLKVKKATMELSEYVMPGLGGRELSEVHALETADALNQINADFIRLRSLAIPNHVELYQHYEEGSFLKLTDTETAQELSLFLENLNNITSTVKSDHILNLFEEIEGQFPDDKAHMLDIVNRYLKLSPHDKMLFQVGRRTGYCRKIEDIHNPSVSLKIESLCEQFGITEDTVDKAIDELMKKFI